MIIEMLYFVVPTDRPMILDSHGSLYNYVVWRSDGKHEYAKSYEDLALEAIKQYEQSKGIGDGD
jgi:hypothetical protein